MFKNELRARRKAAGLTQKTLARLIGAGESTVSEWESGKRSPDIERLPDIAAALGVLPADLLGGGERRNDTWHEPLTTAYEAAVPPVQQAVCNVLQIPHVEPPAPVKRRQRLESKVVYDYPSAAGAPAHIESDYQRIDFPADDVPSDADYGVRITGDSMMPDIQDGDIVWVKQASSISDGQVGIFAVDGGGVCKRAKMGPDGRVRRLMSDNPECDDVELGEGTEVLILGRVVGVWREQ